jgi:hypothetical protein
MYLERSGSCTSPKAGTFHILANTMEDILNQDGQDATAPAAPAEGDAAPTAAPEAPAAAPETPAAA